MMTSFLRAGLLRVVEFSESSQEGLTVRKGAKLSFEFVYDDARGKAVIIKKIFTNFM